MTEPGTLRSLVAYFLRLGTVGFGGPIALAGYMQRDLVEHRRWISEQDYKEGLALAQLARGRSPRSWRSIWVGRAPESLAQRW
jgi:chromate transporter